ncbi:hypothetical protein [Saccharopolyspora karakumensis]|nr:hypothetical protein [Saccharopolyspora karakumensis]
MCESLQRWQLITLLITYVGTAARLILAAVVHTDDHARSVISGH